MKGTSDQAKKAMAGLSGYRNFSYNTILVLFSIIGFAAFTVSNIANSKFNQKNLRSVEHLYFPLIQRIDKIVTNHERINVFLEMAVITEDDYMIDSAKDLMEENSFSFNSITAMDETLHEEIEIARTIEQEYFDEAIKVISEYLENNLSGDGLIGDTTAMVKLYKDSHNHLTKLRSDSYSRFRSVIEETNSAADLSIQLGLFLGLLNLGVIFAIVTLGRKNVKMMYVEKQNETLTTMMANMKQGVFTIDYNLVVSTEYSKHLETILGTNQIAGESLSNVFLNKSQLGPDRISQIELATSSSFGEPRDQFEWNAHLLDREISLSNTHDSSATHLEVDWIPIVDDNDTVQKIMIIIRDVSELRNLNAEAEKRQRELSMIGQILDASSTSFSQFVGSARGYLARNAKMIYSSEPSMETLEALFINVHTIKGNARTHGFSHMTDVIHEVEKYYEVLRVDGLKAWDEERLLQGIQRVDEAINEYEMLIASKLPSIEEDDPMTIFFEEVKESLDVMHDPDDEAQSVYIDHLRDFVMTTRATSIASLARPLQNSCTSLAQELDKYPPTWNIIGGELLVQPDLVLFLSDALVHCVRNSMDYGIGFPEERQAKGQDPAGQISIIAKEENGRFFLELYDDGDGLNLSKLEATGRERGALLAEEPTDEDIASMMFHSGVSTKDGEATQISGRGVGMGAAFELLEQIGGSIRVEFTSPRIENYRKFKLVIDICAEEFLVKPVHLVQLDQQNRKAG